MAPESNRIAFVELDDTPIAVRAPESITTHTHEINGTAFGTKPGALTSRASGTVHGAASLMQSADLAWDPIKVPLQAVIGAPAQWTRTETPGDFCGAFRYRMIGAGSGRVCARCGEHMTWADWCEHNCGGAS